MANRAPTSAVHEARLVETFCSPPPALIAPSGEEAAISAVVAQHLRDLGCTVTTDAKHNVIGRLAGAAAAEPIILSAHLDTVEPGRGVRPRLDNGVIRSDGTTVPGRR